MSSVFIPALVGAIRIFSADYCADQLALALAEPADIVALSVDADKDFSYLRGKANGIAQARADAEKVLAANADVVLRFWGGDAARLERLGVKVVTLGYAADFDAIKENIETAAAAIDRTKEGYALISEIDQRLTALAARGRAEISALYVTPGGVTAGKNTMIDAILNAAGVNNQAADAGHSYWPPLSAEALIAEPPHFIVTGFFSANSERINHWSAARHPALRKALNATPRVDLPTDILSCPGWFSLDAAEAIRNAVDKEKAAAHE